MALVKTVKKHTKSWTET